ncbi:MAG: hypothetical protein GF381_03895 [Candidatus Pacebacteria bacterium]|nr:hypothetical protein [Candidatus Paceibacterota bacterium]
MKKIVFLTSTLSLLLLTAPVQALYQPGQNQPTIAPGTARIMQGGQGEASSDQGSTNEVQTDEQTPSSPSADQVKERVRERVENAQEQAAQNRQQARERLAEIHARRLQRRFNFYYQRLTKLAEKLQTRLNQLELNPEVEQQVQEKLNQAFAYLETAQAQAETSVELFESIDPDQYQAQRQIALQARDQAMTARNNFRSALVELKEAVKLALQNADQPTIN